jgi:hypothetical protein
MYFVRVLDAGILGGQYTLRSTLLELRRGIFAIGIPTLVS